MNEGGGAGVAGVTDPELRKAVAHLSLKERYVLSAKYDRWAQELAENGAHEIGMPLPVITMIADEEERALLYWGRRLFKGARYGYELAARFAMLHALQRPGELGEWFDKLFKYYEAEGVNPVDGLKKNLMSHPCY